MKEILIKEFRARALTVPTEKKESDGTLEWSETTLILVELFAGAQWSMGYTYCHVGALPLVKSLLQKYVVGQNALNIPLLWGKLTKAVRNQGRQGIAAMAISAIDNALWDLKAKLLELSLSDLLGRYREEVPIYGSGGFTSQTLSELKQQMQDWQKLGIQYFKMKVGTHPQEDPGRVHFVRECLGPDAFLMVDGNEAYDMTTALELAQQFSRDRVCWFEQPLRCTDIMVMRDLRQRLPVGMRLTTGEYIYELAQLLPLLQTHAVDVIQLDVTRCQGVTGFLKAAALCEAYDIPISSHCAPSLHVALGCALPHFTWIEYFYDHQRLENHLFAGAPVVKNGMLRPSLEALGFGLTLKAEDQGQWQ
jgi:L-alanine-DL-glutamate epimerase-like enolase superfamily enzyme